MKIAADIHTHTIASDHAFCTITEMAQAAALAGLKGLGISDHAPALGDSPHIYYFQNLVILPRTLFGILILRGAEVNILGENGEIDLPEQELSRLDYTIASMHTPVYLPDTKAQHTKTLLNVIENPYVKILGHPGRAKCDMDMREVVKKARDWGKAIEINAHSLAMSQNINDRCRMIIKICKELSAPVVVNSDAHFSSRVGMFDAAIDILQQEDFPQDLIINATIDRLLSFLNISL